jgi:hypothetical protein
VPLSDDMRCWCDLCLFNIKFTILELYVVFVRSWWPRGLRRWTAGARLFGLRVRIRPGARICVCCACDRLITYPGDPTSFVSLCVIKCNNNLESVDRQRTDLKERIREKERNKEFVFCPEISFKLKYVTFSCFMLPVCGWFGILLSNNSDNTCVGDDDDSNDNDTT